MNCTCNSGHYVLALANKLLCTNPRSLLVRSFLSLYTVYPVFSP